MQRFRQLSVPLDFGGTGPGFTITLTGPSYTVERLSPRTKLSGIEPLKPMIHVHFLDPEPTYWSWISSTPWGWGPLEADHEI